MVWLLLVGCGSKDGGTEPEPASACTEETVVECRCESGRSGTLLCNDGLLDECSCAPVIEGVCESDAQCDDGAFCNGPEVCDPTDEEADGNGCISRDLEPFCDDGVRCTIDSCDGADNRCVFEAPDEDGDGHGDASCLDADDIPAGDDCDDSDPSRYPGAYELCDDDDVDEDCDPETFGLRDQDGDGAIDEACCNGDNCGDDCNDESIAVRPLQPEFCDDVDNDCDGDVDEEAGDVPWYVDDDGDGFGTDASDVIESCIPISGRSLLPTDCSDSVPARHPAQLEICDLADNNCNGLADEGPNCGVPLGFPVVPGSGAVAQGSGGGGMGSGGAGSGGMGSGGMGSGGMGSGGAGSSGMGSGGMGSGGAGSGGMGSGGMGSGGTGTTLNIECDSRDVSGATVADATISSTTTWSGVVHVTTDISVAAAGRLIIEPGTLIVADPGTRLTVLSGRLDAVGTEEEPIKFCGSEATPGIWDGVLLSGSDPESLLEWVLIADAGGGGMSGALTSQAQVPIHNVRIENSGDVGLYATNFGFGSSNVTVTGSVNTSVVLAAVEALARIPQGGTYDGNGEDLVRVLDYAWDIDVTIPNVGVPYFMKSGLRLLVGNSAVFEAGVTVEMEAATQAIFGYSNSAASVSILGTEAEPVVFRRKSGGAGPWMGLFFSPNLDAFTEISHLVVQDAGDGQPAVDINTSIPIDELTIERSFDTGLRMAGDFHPSTQGISIAESAGVAVIVTPNALVTFPGDTQFTDNVIEWVEVSGNYTTETGTIPGLSVPYYFPTGFYTRSPSVLTIGAGAELLFADDEPFNPGWNSQVATLKVLGTAESPVVFDHVNGEQGGWLGVQLGINLVAAESEIRHAVFRNGGSDSKGSLVTQMTTPLPAGQLTDCTFEDSAGFGIYLQAATSEDYSGSGNTFVGNTLGDIGP